MADVLNPVLTREIRARWRNWPAFLVVLCYAGLLALALGWRYASALGGANGVTTSTAPGLGRELFTTITIVQSLGWMLLAPVLTATSIAGERERGTLGNLHLSCLSPYQIVSGKLLSALSFIALMLLVPLPIMAICFPLGGVSPAEFIVALLLHTFTAITCASIGLFCSANSRRSSTALGSALLLIALWCILPPLSFMSPLYASIYLANHGIGMSIISIIFQIGIPFILLKQAANAVLKPLPELPQVQLRSQIPMFAPTPIPQPAPEIVARALPEVPGAKAQQFAQQQSALAIDNSTPAIPQNPVGQWQRLPLVSRLVFDNPVLQREVRIRLQMREGAWGTESQTSPGCWATIGLFFAIFGLFLLVGDRDIRFITWTTFSHLWLVGIIISATIMGALAFSREREQGMLQPLLLSMMSRREIIAGKMVGSLVVCTYYSLALIPVLLPCLRGLWSANGDNLSPVMTFNTSTLMVNSSSLTASGITLLQAVATSLIITATAWSCTACGVALSWFCRQTWVALGWALAAVFLATIAAPFLLRGVGGGLHLWHPYYAMKLILQSGPLTTVLETLCFVTMHGILGLTGLLLIQHLMLRGDREKDSNANLNPEYAR